MVGRRKTDFDPAHIDDSIDWDIVVNMNDGLEGMEGRVVEVRRRYFTITLTHVLLIALSVASSMIGAALAIGYAIGKGLL